MLQPLLRLVLTVVSCLIGTHAHAALSIDLVTPGGGSTGSSDANPQVVYAEKNTNPGQGVVFNVSGLISGDVGSHGDVELTLTLPVGVTIEGDTLPGFSARACTPNPTPTNAGAAVTTCRWTRTNFVVSGTTSQEVSFVLKATAMRVRSGTISTIGATFGTIGQSPATTTHFIQTITKAGLAIGQVIGPVNSFAQRNAIVAGVAGYVVQLQFNVGTVNNGFTSTNGTPAGFTSNPIEYFEAHLSLPPGSNATALRLLTNPSLTVVSQTNTSLVLSNGGVLWTARNPNPVTSITGQMSTNASFVVEVFFPCSAFPRSGNVADLAYNIDEASFRARDANDALMIPQLIGGSVDLVQGWGSARACADSGGSPSGGGDVRKFESSGIDRITAGSDLDYEVDIRPPVGEPIWWDLFVVDRLPTGFWTGSAGGEIRLTGPNEFITHPELRTYACDLTTTPLASTLNFTRADLQSALGFDALTTLPAPRCTQLTMPIVAMGTSSSYVSIPSGTTHIIIDGARRAAVDAPRPLPYDPATTNDWVGVGVLQVQTTLRFGFGLQPQNNPAANVVWASGLFSAGPYAGEDTVLRAFRDDVGTTESFASDGVDEALQTLGDFGHNPATTAASNAWVVEVLEPPVRGAVVTYVYQGRDIVINEGVSTTLPEPFYALFQFQGVGLNLPSNPVFEIDIPPGFEVAFARDNPTTNDPFTGLAIGPSALSFDRISQSDIRLMSSCGAGPNPTDIDIDVVSDGTGTHISIRVNAATPWLLAGWDGNSVIGPGHSSNNGCASMALVLTPQAGSQFEDGDTIDLVSRLYTSGNTTPLDIDEREVRLSATGAVDLSALSLECAADGVRVTGTLANTGAKPFIVAGVEFTLPDAATAEAIEASLVRSGPASFEGADVDVAVVDTVGPSKTVTLTLTADPVLSPFSDGDFAFVIPWSVASGAFSVSAQPFATAVSFEGIETELAPESDHVDTLDPSSCPGSVVITKRFVAGATTPMSGVTFTLSTPSPQSAVTVDGSAVFSMVTPGTWTLSEVTPAATNGATLSGPFDGAWSRTITVAPFEVVALTLDNTCSCSSTGCNEGTCSYDGTTATCTYAPNPALCNDGFYCTTDACVDGVCVTTPTCPTGVDRDACVEDVCDEINDQCVEIEWRPDYCEEDELVIYGVVETTAGLRSFTCKLTRAPGPPGSVNLTSDCDVETDGLLALGPPMCGE